MFDAVEFSIDHVGIPYKENPPFSMELGYSCLGWARVLYDLSGVKIKHSLDDLKLYTRQFRRIENNEIPVLLDIALFYIDIISERHIGVMLNDRVMSHCTHATNGVAISDVTKYPWSRDFKGFYRFNENFRS